MAVINFYLLVNIIYLFYLDLMFSYLHLCVSGNALDLGVKLDSGTPAGQRSAPQPTHQNPLAAHRAPLP